MGDDTILSIDDLNFMLRVYEGEKHILKGVSFDIRRGEHFAVVGESGSGKTVTARLTMGLMAVRGMRHAGSIRFKGRELLDFGPSDWRTVRGREMTMIFQDPVGALNPVFSVGDQLMAVIKLGGERSRQMQRRKALEALERVMLLDPERVMSAYSFQLSGGIAQRVNIAMALVNEPELVIADEPGTALDATIQQQSLQLMRELTARTGTSVMLITHNLAVVRNFGQRMAVMHDGQVVEAGPVVDIFDSPKQAYTRALLDAVPRLTDCGTAVQPHGQERPFIEVIGLRHVYRSASHEVVALDGIDMQVPRGSCTAIVGESGSGKTTLGRLILAMEPLNQGSILLEGKLLSGRRNLDSRRRIQVVQQNPTSALNPKRRVGDSIGLPLDVHGLVPKARRRERIGELLTMVGLDSSFADRYPASLSGGQKQRVALARALACEPDLIVMDEPTSALDVSVQARILDLLNDLRTRLGLTYLFITHDLGVVRRLADRMVVLLHGKLVEQGPTDQIFEAPQHAYTRRLLSSVPMMTEREQQMKRKWLEEWPESEASPSADDLAVGTAGIIAAHELAGQRGN